MPFDNLNWLFLQNLATMVHVTAGVGLNVIHGANAWVVNANATTNAAVFSIRQLWPKQTTRPMFWSKNNIRYLFNDVLTTLSIKD